MDASKYQQREHRIKAIIFGISFSRLASLSIPPRNSLRANWALRKLSAQKCFTSFRIKAIILLSNNYFHLNWHFHWLLHTPLLPNTRVAPLRNVALLFRHRHRLFLRFFSADESISSERKRENEEFGSKAMKEGRRTSGLSSAEEPERRRKTRRRDRWSVTGNRTFRVNLNSEVISIFNFIKKNSVRQSQFLRYAAVKVEDEPNTERRCDEKQENGEKNERRRWDAGGLIYINKWVLHIANCSTK